MANPGKRKGTWWESGIVDYLHDEGLPYVERRALAGNLDRGDIAGIPGVVIEAKNVKSLALGGAVDEANRERDNDRADLGVVWHKRPRKTPAADGFVTMDGRTFVWLLRSAGYLPHKKDDDA